MRVLYKSIISLAAISMVLAAGLLFLAGGAVAGPDRIETRTFDGVEVIKINTVSGNCVVRKGSGDQVEVEVTHSYRPRDSFEPKFSQRGDVLKLSERMYGSNSGHSTWTLTVPENIDIRFSTASGDFEVYGLKGEFDAETASGDIDADNCSGEFDLSTASGDVEMINCDGNFDVSCASGNITLDECTGEFEVSVASGNIDGERMTLTEASRFSTASGRVEVQLAKSAEHDLTLSSASGRATLDYGGNEIQGYIEFTAKDRGGRIVSPIGFDDEETFRRWDDRYVRKWFTRGNDSPEILIQTASGKAVLREG